MTSKRSSVNPFVFTFSRSVKKSLMFPIGYFAAISLFFYYCSSLFNKLDFRLNEGVEKFNRLYGQYKFYFLSESIGGLLMTAIMIALPVAYALYLFRFLNNKKATNVYFSLGISRSKLFFATCLSGVVMLTAAVAVPILAVSFINVYLFGSSKELWLAAAYILCKFLALTLTFYISTVFASCCVGTLVESGFFGLVYGFTPYVFEKCVLFLRENFFGSLPFSVTGWSSSVSGYIIDESSSVASWVRSNEGIVDVYQFLINNNISYNCLFKSGMIYHKPSLRASFILVLLVAVFIFLSFVVFKKRKCEIAGSIGANRIVTGSGVVILSLICIFFSLSLGGYLIGYKLNLKMLFMSVFVIIAIYLIAELLSLRSFKKIISELWKLPVDIGVIIIAIAVVMCVNAGLSKKIPEISQIENVAISTGVGDRYILPEQGYAFISEKTDYDEHGINVDMALGNMTFADEIKLIGGFKDKKDVETITNIHQKLIEITKHSNDNEKIYDKFDERIVPAKVAIVYKLKNGTTFIRSYSYSNDEINRELASLVNTEHYREVMEAAIEMKEIKLEELNPKYIDDTYSYLINTFGRLIAPDISIISPNMSTFVLPICFKDDVIVKDALLEAMTKDIKNCKINPNFVYNDKLLGYISVNSSVFYDLETDEDVYVDVKNINPATLYLSPTTFPVYESMENTVKFLKEYGLYDMLRNTEQPVSMKVWKYDGSCKCNSGLLSVTNLIVGAKYFPDKKTEAVVANGDENNISDYRESVADMEIKMPPTAVEITDEKQIAELTENFKLVYLNCYEGSYAELTFADGTRVYGYIPD